MQLKIGNTHFQNANKLGSLGCTCVKQLLEQQALNQGLLQHLSLKYLQIGDRGCEYIAQGLRVNRMLQSLNLSQNEITGAGIKVLVEEGLLGSSVTIS